MYGLIQVVNFFCLYVCSLGIEPTTFVLPTQCSTTEPQEHYLHGTLSLYTIDFWHKRKNVFLAIAINIPVVLLTGFVLQGHK